MEPNTTRDQDEQPVAYDVSGQPLYAHPEQQATAQTVQVAQPSVQNTMAVPPEIKAKHDQSAALYPSLNLSEHEYVILSVRRHLIGLVLPIAVGFILVVIALTVLMNFDVVVSGLKLTGILANFSIMMWPILLFIFLIAAVMYITYFVYSNNRFFLTNECIIQEIQSAIFDHQEQTVSLGSIKDVSFEEDGIVQQIFDYGTIRLSTIGDDDTYKFTMVSRPGACIATLNNAVKAFKNGQVVGDAIL